MISTQRERHLIDKGMRRDEDFALEREIHRVMHALIGEIEWGISKLDVTTYALHFHSSHPSFAHIHLTFSTYNHEGYTWSIYIRRNKKVNRIDEIFRQLWNGYDPGLNTRPAVFRIVVDVLRFHGFVCDIEAPGPRALLGVRVR